MGMGVIPISPGPVGYRELVEKRLSLGNGITRMPVHNSRHVKAVPVNDGFFRYVVFKSNANVLSLAYVDDRPEIAFRNVDNFVRIALVDCGTVSPDTGWAARKDSPFP